MNPRVGALEEMWYEFAREHKQEIKEMLPGISPWYAIQYWGARYSDYILNKDPRLVEMATKAWSAATANHTPIPARVWFNENKGICPTCGLDMNNLLGKDDFSVVPHINGTCKG